MTWQQLPLAFELQSPLHIGFLPNQPGTVIARTRCYVPGKNLWGAVVANLTPRLLPNLSPAEFRKVGDALRSVIRFSYLYPCCGEKVLAPSYAEGELMWGEMTDREFRTRYVGSYVSTSIGEAGGAAYGTLHEIEFLRDKTRNDKGDTTPVTLAGTVWIKEGAKLDGKQLEVNAETVLMDGDDILRVLTIGGERNYGFGLIHRISVSETLRSNICQLWPDKDPDAVQLLNDNFLLGHLPYEPSYLFKGDVEILGGREYPGNGGIPAFQKAGAHINIEGGYWFTPGTRLYVDSSGLSISVDEWGRGRWVAKP